MRIGITGGIGSGKTTVCRIFEALGVPVYYADDRAKALMTTDAELMAGIRALFGAEAYTSDGALNRPHIAAKAFGNADILAQLNALVHPAVHRDANRWSDAQNAPYTLREAALLYESGGDAHLDRIIAVYAPESVRLERVMARDQATEAQVLARMRQQLSDEVKRERADFVILNDGHTALIPQVHELHQALLALSRNR